MSWVHIIYLGHTWVHITLLQMCMSTHHSFPLPTRRELDLLLTGLLHNNVITLVIFYDLLNTWYLQNLLWVYLLLTSQILYTFVMHMQRHANDEHGGKIMNYSMYNLIKLLLYFYSYGQTWQSNTTTYMDSILLCSFFVVVNRFLWSTRWWDWMLLVLIGDCVSLLLIVLLLGGSRCIVIICQLWFWSINGFNWYTGIFMLNMLVDWKFVYYLIFMHSGRRWWMKKCRQRQNE